MLQVMRLIKRRGMSAAPDSSSEEMSAEMSAWLQHYTGQESAEIPLENYKLASQHIE